MKRELLFVSLGCLCGSAAHWAWLFGWLPLEPVLWATSMGWLLAVSVVCFGNVHAARLERSRRIAVARIRGTRVPDIRHDASAA